MAEAKSKTTRKASTPRPIYLVYRITDGELDVVVASRNPAIVIEAMDEHDNVKSKKLLAA